MLLGVVIALALLAPGCKSGSGSEDVLERMADSIGKAKSFHAVTTVDGNVTRELDVICPDRKRSVETVSGMTTKTIIIGKDTWVNVGQGWEKVPLPSRMPPSATRSLKIGTVARAANQTPQHRGQKTLVWGLLTYPPTPRRVVSLFVGCAVCERTLVLKDYILIPPPPGRAADAPVDR
jgi:hypothetical protein